MAGASHEENPNPAEEDSPLFRTDDFRIWCMKIVPCTKRYVHDWVQCPFAHQNEKAVRRDPRTHDYTGIACPDMKKQATCIRGDSCPYAHNVFEYWLHPTRYRTQLCNDGPSCQRSLCFFAHTMEELRVPAAKPYVSPETLARTSLEAIQRNPHPLGQQLAKPAADMRAAGSGAGASGTGAAGAGPSAVQEPQVGLPHMPIQQQTGLQGQVQGLPPMTMQQQVGLQGFREGLVGSYGGAQSLQPDSWSAGRPSLEQQVLHSGFGSTGRLSFQDQQQVQAGFGSAGRFSMDEQQLQARLGSTGRPARELMQGQVGFSSAGRVSAPAQQARVGSAGRVPAPAQQLLQPGLGAAGRFSLDEHQLQARLALGARPTTGQPQLQPGFGSAGRVSAPQPGFGSANRVSFQDQQAQLQPGFGSAGRVSAPQPGFGSANRGSFKDQRSLQPGFGSAGRLSFQEHQQPHHLPLLPGATQTASSCRSTSDLSRKSQDHMRLWLAEQLGPTLPPLAAASVAVSRSGSRKLSTSTSCRLSSEAVRPSGIAATSSLYRPAVDAPFAMAGGAGLGVPPGPPPSDAGMYAAGRAPTLDAPESPLLSAGGSSTHLPGVGSAEASLALSGESPRNTNSPSNGTEQDLAQALASLKITLTQQQVASSSGSNHDIVITTLHQILKDAVNQQAAAASAGTAPSFQDLLAATPLASEAKLERPGSASSPNSITGGGGRLSTSSNV